MKEIAIHEIADGQVLAGDTFDDHGSLLLSAGMTLTREHIGLLERRGVLTVKIVDEEAGRPSGPEAPSADDFEKALERLDHMFEGEGDDPIMRAIYAAARGMLESARGAEPPRGRTA